MEGLIKAVFFAYDVGWLLKPGSANQHGRPLRKIPDGAM